VGNLELSTGIHQRRWATSWDLLSLSHFAPKLSAGTLRWSRMWSLASLLLSRAR